MSRDDIRQFEKEHVNDIYERISEYFDDTRYRPWECVKTFLFSLPKGSKVLEVGCGNGVNMCLGKSIGLDMYGCDICGGLLSICHQKGFDDLTKCDCRHLPYTNERFDATICIAVLNHLVLKCDRINAIMEMCRVTSQDGSIFIVLWNKTEYVDNVNKFTAIDIKSLLGTQSQNDYFVNWVETKEGKKENLSRYYHMYDEQEFLELQNILSGLLTYKRISMDVNRRGFLLTIMPK